MKAICLYCDAEKNVVYEKNKKYRCDKCNAAMAPFDAISKMKNDLPNIDTTEFAYKLFSHCPNAQFCYVYDLYKPSCEDLVFTPACLHWLFSTLDSTLRAFSHMGKTLYSLITICLF